MANGYLLYTKILLYVNYSRVGFSANCTMCYKENKGNLPFYSLSVAEYWILFSILVSTRILLQSSWMLSQADFTHGVVPS